MIWFKPTSETIAFLAETCLAIVILLYLLSLKKNDGISFLYISLIFTFFLYSFVGIIYSASFPTPTFFVKFCNGASVGLLEYCSLIFALYYPKNYYPKESIIALLLLLLPTAQILFSADPSTFDLVTLSTYILLFAYIIWLYTRKIKQTEKAIRVSNTSNIIEHEKEKKFYKISILTSSFNFAIFSSLFIALTNLDFYYVWTVLVHILALAAFTINTYNILNYSQQSTSFRAKLSGIILCVVLIVLGILPFILLGPKWFDQTGNKELNETGNILPQSILYTFLILIPVVTLLILGIFPVLLKKVILHPLNRILSGVKEVNSGKLDTEIGVLVNDEIGALSDNFNQMTSSLRRYANKMNDLVDERTSALNQSLHELRSTQAQLIQSEKMASLGELTAGIAHEIQNPLNFVNNFSEINTELIDELLEEVNVGNIDGVKTIAGEISENEDKINLHGKRADAIVKGMLQHSRSSTGKMEAININTLVDEYLRLSYHGLRAKDNTLNADFKTNFDESIEKISVIPQDIGRILLNVFNNAFYAAAEQKKFLNHNGKDHEPKVLVTTQAIITPLGVHRLEISVRDNGNGISEKNIDKIFQPFFTTKPSGQGTGLGLSISYDIIKAHNGEFKVKSQQGEGSTFTIRL